jgi:hypothetical protein
VTFVADPVEHVGVPGALEEPPADAPDPVDAVAGQQPDR